MRRLILVIFILWASFALGQTTIVTATVTAPDGSVFANGTGQATFTPPGGDTNCNKYTINGSNFNCIVGGQSNSSWVWPGTHNVFPANETAVQFTNYNNGLAGNYQLQVTSPCHNVSDDGTDSGANISTVNNMIQGVQTLP